MKVYIDAVYNILVFGRYDIPTGHYIIEWDKYSDENPTKFRFLSAGSNTPLPMFLDSFVDLRDCQYLNGTYYTTRDEFLAAIGSFFVRALTVAEGALDTRLTNLEDNDTIYQLFQYVGTSTSGQITIPAEAAIFDFYNDGIVDAIVVKADANQNPTTELSVNSGGDIVHVASLNGAGAYTLTPTQNSPACIIYYIIIKDEFKGNVPYASVISEEKRVLSVPYADFEKLSTVPAHKTGRVYYDDVAKALSYYTHIPNTSIQVGQETVVYVRNNSGAQINDGTPVYITGAIGQIPTIGLASAASKETTCLLGLATHDIADNSNGFVTIGGEVRGLNTAAYTDGLELYLGVTPGTFSAVSPPFPNFAISVGTVEHAHNTQGKILVRPGLRANNHVVLEHLAIRTDFRSPIAKVGDLEAGNYSEFEADGTYVAKGNAATWVDIDFPIIIRTTGTNVPTITAINGNLTMPQWAVNDFAMSESQEFIHKWKEGSTCYWHLHLNTNGTDTTDRYVRFSIEYGYTDGNSLWTFPAVFTTPDILIPANTPSKTQIIMPITNFTPTGSRIGGHVVARLTRVASTGLAPTNNPWIPMLQMHVLCDTNGSRNMTTK